MDFILANPPFNNNDWGGDQLRSGPMEVWCKIKLSLNHIKHPIKDKYDAIILAVAHNEFKSISENQIRSYGKNNHVLYDIKYLLKSNESDGRL